MSQAQQRRHQGPAIAAGSGRASFRGQRVFWMCAVLAIGIGTSIVAGCLPEAPAAIDGGESAPSATEVISATPAAGEAQTPPMSTEIDGAAVLKAVGYHGPLPGFGYAFDGRRLVAFHQRLLVIDVAQAADPIAPVGSIVGSSQVMTGSMTSVLVDGDTAYTLWRGSPMFDEQARLMVWDIAGPVRQYGTLPLPGEPRHMAQVGGHLVVTDGSAVHMIDVGDPSTPVMVDTVSLPGKSVSIATSGDLVVVAVESDRRQGGEEGLQLLGARSEGLTSERFVPLGPIGPFALHDGSAYVGSPVHGSGHVTRVPLLQPDEPTQRIELPRGRGAIAVAVADGWLYTLRESRTVPTTRDLVVDALPLDGRAGALSESVPGHASHFAVHEGVVALLPSSGTLHFFDASGADAVAESSGGGTTGESFARNLQLFGLPNRLWWLPRARLHYEKGRLYMAGLGYQFVVLDVGDAAAPQVVDTYGQHLHAVAGTRGLVEDDDGLALFDLQSGTASGRAPTVNDIVGATVTDGAVFTAERPARPPISPYPEPEATRGPEPPAGIRTWRMGGTPSLQATDFLPLTLVASGPFESVMVAAGTPPVLFASVECGDSGPAASRLMCLHSYSATDTGLTPLGAWESPAGRTPHLLTAGDGLAILEDDGQVLVIDASDPHDLTLVSDFTVEAGSTLPVAAIANRILYVGMSEGLRAFDLADPAAPRPAGMFPIRLFQRDPFLSGIAVSDTAVFLSDFGGDLWILGRVR